MASITLKGLPEELYRRIKESAAANYRSINREILYRLDRSLGGATIDPEEFLARADRLRGRMGVRLTDLALRKARETGRP